MDRINGAASVGDGGSDGASAQFGSQRRSQDDEAAKRTHRLVSSGDKRDFTQADKAALALAEQCFARAFAREFAIPYDKLVVKHLVRPDPVADADPQASAERIYQAAARAIALGRARGLADIGQALGRAAESSVTEMFEALIDVGTFDGDGGVAVQEMLEHWGARLAYLANNFDS